MAVFSIPSRCLFLLLLFAKAFPAAPSQYKLDPKWDYTVLGIGTLSAGLSYLREREIASHDIDPDNFNRKEIPYFDRWAIGYYSKPMSTLSDILIGMNGLAPVLLTGLNFRNGDESLEDAWTDAILYGQVIAYASAFSLYSKTFLLHPRPLVYNTNAPQSERTSGDSRSGFFSEHATGAFAAAIFTGYTFQIRHRDSPWVPWIWAGALGTATTVGALRVASGKHFPSDVLAGAAVGSLVGYTVPRLHIHSRISSQRNSLDSKPKSFLSRIEFSLAPSPDAELPMIMICIHG